MSETFTGVPWDIGYSAQQLADAAANQVPYIDQTTRHWMRWNIATGAYEDTGITAEGQDGEDGEVTTAQMTAAIAAAVAPKAKKALAFTVTLAASGWSNDAQTVSNANFIVSGYSYVVSPASASFEAYAEAQIYADDVTTAGRMTFHCGDVPSAALTVNILRVEVQ